MATKLAKPVSREVSLEDKYGHIGEVVVTMQPKGLKFRKKNTSRSLFIPWEAISKSMALPGNAPAKYAGNPLGWLVE